jgi:hypothetical protein
LVNNAPSQPQVTAAFFRQITVNLRDAIRLIAIIALVIAAIAWLFGGSRSATAVRVGVRSLRARVDSSPLGIVVRVAAGVAAVVLVLILLAIDDPGLIVAVVLVVAAGLATFAAAAPSVAPQAPDPGEIATTKQESAAESEHSTEPEPAPRA